MEEEGRKVSAPTWPSLVMISSARENPRKSVSGSCLRFRKGRIASERGRSEAGSGLGFLPPKWMIAASAHSRAASITNQVRDENLGSNLFSSNPAGTRSARVGVGL